jgi:hypothetical protein
MTVLYKPSYLLNIGVEADTYLGVHKRDVQDAAKTNSLVIDSLNISFKVNKSRDNKKASNKATISIWNLSEATRNKLSSKKGINVTLYVGYGEVKNLGLIVQGNITRTNIERNGPDIITTLTVDENFVALNNTRVVSTLPAGKTIGDVIESIRQQMSEQSIADGGPEIVKGDYQGDRINSTLLYGRSLNGTARQALDELCLAYGLEWNLNESKLNIKDEEFKTENNPSALFIMSQESGLLSTPVAEWKTGTVKLTTPIKEEVTDENGKKKTKTRSTKAVTYTSVKFKSLMIPEIKPGSIIQFESKLTEAYRDRYYQVQNIEYSGEWRGNFWGLEAECNEVELV